jgi:hypothetical protein
MPAGRAGLRFVTVTVNTRPAGVTSRTPVLDCEDQGKGGDMPASAKPSLRFFHSAALRKRTNKVLGALERDEDPTQHASALSALVVDLTEAGLDYYFIKPLKQAKVGFVARQTASFGMSSALRVMSPMIRGVLASTSGNQLRVIGGHIRELM